MLVISNRLTCPPLVLHEFNFFVNILLLHNNLVFVIQCILQFGHLLLQLGALVPVLIAFLCLEVEQILIWWLAHLLWIEVVVTRNLSRDLMDLWWDTLGSLLRHLLVAHTLLKLFNSRCLEWTLASLDWHVVLVI